MKNDKEFCPFCEEMTFTRNKRCRDCYRQRKPYELHKIDEKPIKNNKGTKDETREQRNDTKHGATERDYNKVSGGI